MPEKLIKRKKNILITAIALAVIFLMYLILIAPMAAQLNAINSRIHKTKAELEKALALIKDKTTIEEEYDSIFGKISALSSDEQEIASILNTLQKAASNSGIKITAMRPRPVKQSQYYRYFESEVEIESDMASLMKFIYDIKNSNQLIRIDRLNVNANSRQGSSGIKAFMLISKPII
jgi:Tfp pilus assembly protein PilO